MTVSVIATDRRAVLEELAALSEYPTEGWLDRLGKTAARLVESAPGAASALLVTRGELASSTDGELEELYTRTFDMAPDHTLDLGWHVHGETYKRGNLLVELRRLETAHGVDAGGELPDHLGVFLRLLARLDDAEAERLAPTAHKALVAVRRALDAQANPLRGVVAAIALVLGAPEPDATAGAPVTPAATAAEEV